jgi:hypothetical protein
MVYSQDFPRCRIERDGYALCHHDKNMCQNIKYNTRYDSLSIALTYMSIATLGVGHLRMVKLLECFTTSSQTMASNYAHGLLFYHIVAC